MNRSIDVRRWLETVREKYDEIESFYDPDSLFNRPAPEPIVSFAIGGALSILGFILWTIRLGKMRKKIKGMGASFQGSLILRAMISAMVDEDSPFYSFVSFSAVSFLFLGVLQQNWNIGLIVMLAYYVFKACLETFRILLGYWSANDLSDVIEPSKRLKSELQISSELQPKNMYEDLSRGALSVGMVFVSQSVLIAMVISTLTEDETTCWDNTWPCPITGTLGSWLLFVFGILMAMVYKEGPATSFGHSPQNPGYWLQILLCAKQKGSTFTWLDLLDNETKTAKLSMFNVLIRFAMSFLINGISFQLLVHSLPIKVAEAYTFYDIVWASYGMMWLVDLDTTWGPALTVSHPKNVKDTEKNSKDSKSASEGAENLTSDGDTETKAETVDTDKVSAEAQKIIDEAIAKLQAMSKGHGAGIDEKPRGKNATHDMIAGKLLVIETKPGAGASDESPRDLNQESPISNDNSSQQESLDDIFYA